MLKLPFRQKAVQGLQHTSRMTKHILQVHFVLIDCSLTVKAATLLFISGRASAISSSKQEKSGSICNLVKK